MNDKYIINSFDTIHIDEKSMLKKVKDGINPEIMTPEASRFAKKSKRKYVVIFAAILMVLAFGAISYGLGIFNLGILKDPHSSIEYEFVGLEGTNQYNAAKEYNDYVNSLPFWELKKLESNQGIQFDETTGIVTGNKPSGKLLEIIEKYHLKYAIKSYVVKSPTVALENAGLAGFADEFLSLHDDGSGTYNYNDIGRLNLVNNVSKEFWEFSCYPEDVYMSPNAFFYPNDNIEEDTFSEWYYTTKDGHIIKLISYVLNGAYENENGTETASKIRVYKAITIAEKYMFKIHFQKSMEGGSDMSKTEFEALLEEFDYSMLD